MRLRVPRAESARPERDEVRMTGPSCSVASGERLVVLMVSPCVFSQVTVNNPTSCRSTEDAPHQARQRDDRTSTPTPQFLQIIIIIDLY